MAYLGGELDRRIIDAWTAPERVRYRPAPLDPSRLGPAPLDPALLGPVDLGAGGPGEQFVERRGLLVPQSAVRDAATVSLGASAHPRGIGYDLDAVTRGRMVHSDHPGWILSCWTAAAQWGLEYFVDDADTCALTGGSPRLAAGSDDITRRRRTRQLSLIDPVATDERCPELLVTPPVLTTVHCLQSVLAGQHAWKVLPGSGLTDTGVRAVQLLDGLCRIYGIDPQELPAACGNHIDRDFLTTVVGYCDRGADSPPETLLRLLVGRYVTGSGLRFVSQLVVHADGTVSDPVHGGDERAGRIVARLDLACPELKLALQYDGSGHLGKDTRDRDSRINTELANLGWHVLRLTWGHLRDLRLLAETLAAGIRVCEERLR